MMLSIVLLGVANLLTLAIVFINRKENKKNYVSVQ